MTRLSAGVVLVQFWAILVTVATASAQIPVTAAWDPNDDGGLTRGYRVFVGTPQGASLAALDVGMATSIILPLPPGNAYTISVRAYSVTGVVGPPSVEATVDLANSPGTPAAFAATTSSTSASLSWEPPRSGGMALGYLLSVGTAPGASNLLNDYPLGNVTRISGALPPGVYYARVQAHNFVGAGPASVEVGFRVGASLPPPPASLRFNWNGSAVRLTWNASVGATSYVIEAGTSAGAVNVVSFNAGNVTSFAADVPPGTFYVRIRAVSAAGVGGASNEIVLRR